MSKLYEGVSNDQMLDHFREIFDVLLSTYKRHNSCQTILLKFVEDVKSALDGSNKMGAVFMDLSKAFDYLPHGLSLPHCMLIIFQRPPVNWYLITLVIANNVSRF